MIYFDSSKMLMQDNLKVSFHLLNIFKFLKKKKEPNLTKIRKREWADISHTTIFKCRYMNIISLLSHFLDLVRNFRILTEGNLVE